MFLQGTLAGIMAACSERRAHGSVWPIDPILWNFLMAGAGLVRKADLDVDPPHTAVFVGKSSADIQSLVDILASLKVRF